ncbi:hypothetical protein [Streptomyces sp. NPDC001985]
MSAAAVGHPGEGDPRTLLHEAEALMARNPGQRVEIIGGAITASTPPASW